jgi:hypothetical protein
MELKAPATALGACGDLLNPYNGIERVYVVYGKVEHQPTNPFNGIERWLQNV